MPTNKPTKQNNTLKDLEQYRKNLDPLSTQQWVNRFAKSNMIDFALLYWIVSHFIADNSLLELDSAQEDTDTQLIDDDDAEPQQKIVVKNTSTLTYAHWFLIIFYFYLLKSTSAETAKIRPGEPPKLDRGKPKNQGKQQDKNYRETKPSTADKNPGVKSNPFQDYLTVMENIQRNIKIEIQETTLATGIKKTRKNIPKKEEPEKNNSKINLDKNLNFDPALFEAIKANKLEMVKEILQAPAKDVNAKNSEGLTPLFGAAAFGNEEITRLLLEHGADVNSKGPNGETPIFFAVQNNHLPIVKLLIENENGADLNIKIKVDILEADDVSILHAAAARNFYEIVKLLLNHGMDANLLCSKNVTPLHMAMMDEGIPRENREETVRTLLRRGANINAQNSGGRTALHFAVLNEEIDVGFLLEKGVDANLIDEKNYTALVLAAQNGNAEAVIEILKFITNTKIKVGDLEILTSAIARTTMQLVTEEILKNYEILDYFEQGIDLQAFKKLKNSFSAEIRSNLEVKLTLVEAGLLERTNQTAEAQNLLQSLVEKNPNNYLIQYNLGTFYLRKFQPREALSYLNTVVNLLKTNKTYQALKNATEVWLSTHHSSDFQNTRSLVKIIQNPLTIPAAFKEFNDYYQTIKPLSLFYELLAKSQFKLAKYNDAIKSLLVSADFSETIYQQMLFLADILNDETIVIDEKKWIPQNYSRKILKFEAYQRAFYERLYVLSAQKMDRDLDNNDVEDLLKYAMKFIASFNEITAASTHNRENVTIYHAKAFLAIINIVRMYIYNEDISQAKYFLDFAKKQLKYFNIKKLYDLLLAVESENSDNSNSIASSPSAEDLIALREKELLELEQAIQIATEQKNLIQPQEKNAPERIKHVDFTAPETDSWQYYLLGAGVATAGLLYTWRRFYIAKRKPFKIPKEKFDPDLIVKYFNEVTQNLTSKPITSLKNIKFEFNESLSLNTIFPMILNSEIEKALRLDLDFKTISLDIEFLWHQIKDIVMLIFKLKYENLHNYFDDTRKIITLGEDIYKVTVLPNAYDVNEALKEALQENLLAKNPRLKNLLLRNKLNDINASITKLTNLSQLFKDKKKNLPTFIKELENYKMELEKKITTLNKNTSANAKKLAGEYDPLIAEIKIRLKRYQAISSLSLEDFLAESETGKKLLEKKDSALKEPDKYTESELTSLYQDIKKLIEEIEKSHKDYTDSLFLMKSTLDINSKEFTTKKNPNQTQPPNTSQQTPNADLSKTKNNSKEKSSLQKNQQNTSTTTVSDNNSPPNAKVGINKTKDSQESLPKNPENTATTTVSDNLPKTNSSKTSSINPNNISLNAPYVYIKSNLQEEPNQPISKKPVAPNKSENEKTIESLLTTIQIYCDSLIEKTTVEPKKSIKKTVNDSTDVQTAATTRSTLRKMIRLSEATFQCSILTGLDSNTEAISKLRNTTGHVWEFFAYVSDSDENLNLLQINSQNVAIFSNKKLLPALKKQEKDMHLHFMKDPAFQKLTNLLNKQEENPHPELCVARVKTETDCIQHFVKISKDMQPTDTSYKLYHDALIASLAFIGDTGKKLRDYHSYIIKELVKVDKSKDNYCSDSLTTAITKNCKNFPALYETFKLEAQQIDTYPLLNLLSNLEYASQATILKAAKKTDVFLICNEICNKMRHAVLTDEIQIHNKKLLLMIAELVIKFVPELTNRINQIIVIYAPRFKAKEMAQLGVFRGLLKNSKTWSPQLELAVEDLTTRIANEAIPGVRTSAEVSRGRNKKSLIFSIKKARENFSFFKETPPNSSAEAKNTKDESAKAIPYKKK